MAPVKRFLFDNRTFDPDFDPDQDDALEYEDEEDEVEEEIEEPPAPTFTEEELAQAQQRSFEDGKAAGLQEANAQFEHLIASALTQISQTIPGIFEDHSKTQLEHEAHALAIATAVAKKIIPAYAEKNGLEEIIHVVKRCLEPLHTEPRILVKVHESLREDIQEKLLKVAEEVGFEGRLVVMPNEEIIPGDCRIDWSEGGAERNSDDLWQQIDEIIGRNLTQDIIDEKNPEIDAETATASPETVTMK